MGMIEDVKDEIAEIKRMQERQDGDLIRIENNIKELDKKLYGAISAVNQLEDKLDMIIKDINKLPQPRSTGVSAEQVRAIVEMEVGKIRTAIPKSQPPMDEQDRTLLKQTINNVHTVYSDNKWLLKLGGAVVVLLLAYSLWNQYLMRQEVKQVSTNYDRITAILSRDKNYWFDGDNFNIAQESPTADYLRQVYAKYQEEKTERAKQSGQ